MEKLEQLAVGVKKAAEVLDISPHTIRKMIRTGQVKASRIGRRVIISTEELRRLLGQR
jgi:excisionase family DNA binding protein